MREEVVDLQVKIEDVLSGRARGAADTLRQVRPIVTRARGFAEDLLRELEGNHVA